MNVEQTLRHILNDRIIAVVRCRTEAEAACAIEAMIAGGVRTVEITTTTPGWEGLITRTVVNAPEVVTGVGTLLELDQIERAAQAGARFAASPIYDPEVMASVSQLGMLRMPGGATPTELYHAHRDGCELLKLFPTPPDPAAFLRTIRGPLPHLPIAPSGGVTDITGPAILAAGAAALNVGSWLTHRSDGTPLTGEEIRERAQRLRAALSSNTA